MAKSMSEMVEATREELRRLTGLKLSSTVETAKSDEGWRVCVEMVEKSSIPDGMDVLATYEVLLDAEGQVLEFKRKGLRKRIETDGQGER